MSDCSGRSAHRARARALIALVLLLVVGCTGGPAEPLDVVRVGAGSTTEQQVLAALTVELLERNLEAAEVVPDLGSSVRARDAALDGAVDVYWDYSGAAWALSLGLTAPPVDPQESFEAIAFEEAERGLRWLGPAAVDARLAFFVERGALAGEEPTLSWLASTLGTSGGALCADQAYLSAPAGYAYLVDVYAIGTDDLVTTAASEAEALEQTAAGECTAGLASATSGPGRSLDLVPLRDDQGVFPALALSPVVVAGGVAADPAVVGLLEDLAGLLTTDVLAQLNAAAGEGTPIDQLAQQFLDGAGL